MSKKKKVDGKNFIRISSESIDKQYDGDVDKDEDEIDDQNLVSQCEFTETEMKQISSTQDTIGSNEEESALNPEIN